MEGNLGLSTDSELEVIKRVLDSGFQTFSLILRHFRADGDELSGSVSDE
jgi:hypothetical protein